MADDPLIGRVLHDTHRIVRLLGRGGMGAVYEAAHVRLSRQRFAVKVLHEGMVDDPITYERFRREAEVTTAIGHPNIVYVTDFYETSEGRPCIVMEYLDGMDLQAQMKRQSRLPVAQIQTIVTTVADALQAAHDMGVVHRDLKPANIFLASTASPEPTVKVLDFGISKIRDATTLTNDMVIMGTPHYMSPEQGEGSVKEVDHRTDVFSLGIICYQMLTGTLPFSAPSLLGIIRAICDKPFTPVTELTPSIPPAVDRVLGRALSKRKQDRFDRVDELAQALTEALEDTSSGATVALPPPSPLSRTTASTPVTDRHAIDPTALTEVSPGPLLSGIHTPATGSASARAQGMDADGVELRTAVAGIDEVLNEATSSIPRTQAPASQRALEADHERSSEATPPPTVAAPKPVTTLSGSAGEAPASRPRTSPGNTRARSALLAAVGAALALSVGVGLLVRPGTPAGTEPRASGASRQVDLPGVSTTDTPSEGPVNPPESVVSPPTPRHDARIVAAAGEAPEETEPLAPQLVEPPYPREPQVEIRLSVRPSHAEIVLDGDVIHGRLVRLDKDGTRHTMSIRAPGFQTQDLSFRAVKNRKIRVRLHPTRGGR